jgi:hypothetical protein
MFVPPLVIVSVIVSGVFFLWNYASRVGVYNGLLVSAQAPTGPAEIIGMIDAVIKSLGIHAFVGLISALVSVLSGTITIEPPGGVLGLLLSVLVLTWPIFFGRRIVYEAALDAFQTPDWKDDSVIMLDIFFRSAGVCQVLAWIFGLVLAWISG